MTLNDFAKLEGYTRAKLARALTEQIKAYDKEADPIYENRLYRLMGGAPAREHELRALIGLTGGVVDSYKS